MFTRNISKLRRLPYRRYRVTIAENDTQISVMDNGIKVATEETKFPIACVSLFIQTGPRYETCPNNGISHFIEHMAFKGSTSVPKRSIEEFALMSGSRLDAQTYHEFQRFSITCNPECLQGATEVLGGIVQLTMDQSEIEEEWENICREMGDIDKDYKALVFENLVRAAFQGTSLGQRVVGSSCNIASFDSKRTLEFMEDWYQPWRLAFATAGPINNGCMKSYVNSVLGNLQTTNRDQTRLLTRFSAGSIIYRDDSRNFAHIAIAFEAPSFISKDFLSMLVLKNIIGSWDKTASVFGTWPELAMRCLDTELCESYESIYLTFQDIGLWGVYFVCGRMEAEDFVTNWQDVVKSMCCMMRQADVDRAKRATQLELCRERTGVFNSSVSLGKEIMYRTMRPTLAQYVTALDALERAELQNLAYRILYNAQPVVSGAGPTESLQDYTRIASGQYWIRW